MNDNDLNNLKISEECLDSLRQAYSNVNEKAVDDCSMSELAIACAAGELQPDENQKFRNHLYTCNYCLNLVLDFKISERDSVVNSKHTPKVLPGLSKAIKANKSIREKDSAFKKLPALLFNFCSPLLSPKFIAVAVTACLAFIIINFGLNDPQIREKLGEVNKRIVAEENPKKPSPALKSDFTSNQDSQKEPIDQSTNTYDPSRTYDPTGRIDPFESLFSENPKDVKMPKLKKRVPRTPLERIDLSQLKLVGIMLSESGNTALLEDATGKGYVIKNDTYIGTKGGKVVEISKARVIIEEEFEDEFGKISIKKIELKLQKKP